MSELILFIILIAVVFILINLAILALNLKLFTEFAKERFKREKEIPKFQTLEEEREYWEARGPLADGHKWKIIRPHGGKAMWRPGDGIKDE